MGWNFDIDAAPRGTTEIVTRKVGKSQTDAQFEVFRPDYIIAASKCGIVTRSHWIPPAEKAAGRWEMFANGEEPIAWQPWPTHPTA